MTAESPSTSRLMRMVLINARCSGQEASGAITEIDPRGGAAIVGENTVGKTTTLELIPLFFGHLPSHIVEPGTGKDPMLRFVLPAAQSAIVFEYLRGPSEEHDVRFVVLRRAADGVQPEYRLFRSPFRKDLFVGIDGDGRSYFLNDEEVVSKARNLNIKVEGKLSSSDYRSVILRTPSRTQEAKRLATLAGDYSFSTKRLPNLDRVAAAVVKKHIHLDDFVQVAISMIRDRSGLALSPRGSARLSLRQAPGQIESWLLDRDACEDAQKLAPRVAEMRDLAHECNARTDDIRAVRGEAEFLQVLLQTARAKAGEQLEALERSRAEALEREATERTAREDAVNSAAERHQSAELARNTGRATEAHYRTEMAEHWAAQQDRLPGLRAEQSRIRDQLLLAEGTVGDLTRAYEAQVMAVNDRAAADQAALEALKEPNRQMHREEIAGLRLQQDEAEARAEEAHRERLVALEDQIGELQSREGELRAHANRPEAPQPLLDARDSARSVLTAHKADVAQKTAKAALLALAKANAAHAFRESERRVSQAREAVRRAQQDLETARANVAPAPGTLLASLRDHPSKEWVGNLARVIAPELLKREDLSPRFTGDGGETAYGWSFDLSVLPPALVGDEAALAADIELAKARHEAAATGLKTLEAEMEDFAGAHARAEQDHTLAESEASIATGRTQGHELNLAQAELAVENALRAAAAKTNEELRQVRADVVARRAEKVGLEQEFTKGRTALRQGTTSRINQADERLKRALGELDRQITERSNQAEKAVEELHAQRDQQLSANGVDVKQLRVLEEQLQTLYTDIETIEGKKGLVSAWRKWVAEGGPAALQAAEAEVVQTDAALQAARAAFVGHKRACTISQDIYQGDRTRAEGEIQAIDKDLALLREVESLTAGYWARPFEPLVGQACATAVVLRNRAADLLNETRQLSESLKRKFNDVRSKLTSRPGAVADLVEKMLDEVADKDDLQARVSKLSLAYRSIGPQVVRNVNTTLRTVLEAINQFNNTIANFRSEVGKFNTDLQTGIDRINGFKRLQEFKVGVVTDFSSVGFLQKLEPLKDIIRSYHAQRDGDPNEDLPTAATAAALREFKSLIGPGGSLELDLSEHITLAGSVEVNHQKKPFRSAVQLENISSNGMSSIVLIALLCGLINMIRGDAHIYVPWCTDEATKYDPGNFAALLSMFRDNKIDFVTASPALTIPQYRLFARRYRFGERSSIAEAHVAVASLRQEGVTA